MASRTQYYNDHIVFVSTGIASYEQLDESIRKMILKLNKPCNYLINLVKMTDYTTKKEILLGHAYVWFSNVEVAYALTGKNFDGSDRVKYENDPKWIPPAQDKEILLKEAYEKAGKTYGINPLYNDEDDVFSEVSWADINEEDEEQNEIEEGVARLYTPIQIEIPLDPLVKLDGYNYTSTQLNHLKTQAVKNKEIGEIPPKGYFEISRAWAHEAPSDKISSTLICTNVPDWVTDEGLKIEFSRFVSTVSSTRKTVTTSIRNGMVNIQKQGKTYPMVSVKRNETKDGSFYRMAYVSFQEDTHDGKFALLMCKKLYYQCPTDSSKSCILFFNYYDNGKIKTKKK